MASYSKAATKPEPLAAELIKGKCDLCVKPDGYGGHNLQKCKDCGLLARFAMFWPAMHELCYATVPTSSKNPDFVCHACKAVGKEVEVNVPSKVGGSKTISHREIMTQETRPVECALCSVKTGIHAMHPLFDMPGPEGRQLVLHASGTGFKKKEKRLAFVHSLCAQFINSNDRTRGCVYGLYEGGKFEDEGEDSEDEAEQRKPNSHDEQQHEEQPRVIYEIGTEVSKWFETAWFTGKIVGHKNDDDGTLLYEILYEDGDKEDLEQDELEEVLVSHGRSEEESLVATEAFTIRTDSKFNEIIRDSRELKCTICNSIDKHSLRIPVQCKAYDKHEFKEFRKCHKKVTGVTRQDCRLAVHVGCARWATKNYAGVKGKSLRMCYFYPGQTPGYAGRNVIYKDPVCDAFCRVHAREVMEHMNDAVKSEESEEEPESPQVKAAKVIASKKRKNAFLDDSDEDG